MFIRCAFFEGKIKPGQEAAFHQFVRERLVPVWQSFPGAEEVRILRPHDADFAEPAYAMVLAIGYADRAAIERIMESPPRQKAKAETAELVKMFDGRIFHINFEADQFPVL